MLGERIPENHPHIFDLECCSKERVGRALAFGISWEAGGVVGGGGEGRPPSGLRPHGEAPGVSTVYRFIYGRKVFFIEGWAASDHFRMSRQSKFGF